MKNIPMVTVKVITITACIILSACTTVKYGDAQSVETVNTDFSSTDLQLTAEKMVDSLLSFPPVIEMTKNARPVVFVERLKNKTTEHIDTESITDTISTRLLRSGKFRFVDMSKVDEVRRQLNFQTSGGLVDESTAIQMGKQVGAELMLYGNLSSIVKRDSSTKDVYYKFTLKLMSIESGLIEWQDEKEIRKVQGKSLFGL